MSNKKIPFIFFGTPDLAVFVLEELEKGGLLPSAVVTAPDRLAGRGMHLTSSPVKVWAQERNTPVLQPEQFDNDFLIKLEAELGVVAAYGKIIPQAVLDIFPHGLLNVHPSLLPKYRGPTPVETALLNGDEKTGVTIMELDAKMDHGNIISNFEFRISNEDTKQKLSEKLFRKGGQMLVEVIPQWIAGELESTPQNHEKATYTKKLKKEDGHIDLDDNPEINWRKFRAYTPWPGTYFFADGKRIKITNAELEDGEFIIKKVIPEGRSEMEYAEWKNSFSS